MVCMLHWGACVYLICRVALLNIHQQKAVMICTLVILVILVMLDSSKSKSKEKNRKILHTEMRAKNFWNRIMVITMRRIFIQEIYWRQKKIKDRWSRNIILPSLRDWVEDGRSSGWKYTKSDWFKEKDNRFTFGHLSLKCVRET